MAAILAAPEWWHWLVFGIGLMLLELVLPAFFIIWFGLGALVVALVLLMWPAAGLTAQLGLWTLSSVAMVFVWFLVFKPTLFKTRVGMASADVVGEIGLLVRDVAPYARGQVRFQKPLVGAELWDCIADEPIQAGERVRVLTVEGSFIKVGKT